MEIDQAHISSDHNEILYKTIVRTNKQDLIIRACTEGRNTHENRDGFDTKEVFRTLCSRVDLVCYKS